MENLKELMTSLLGRVPEIWELTEIVEAVDKDKECPKEKERDNSPLFG